MVVFFALQANNDPRFHSAFLYAASRSIAHASTRLRSRRAATACSNRGKRPIAVVRNVLSAASVVSKLLAPVMDGG